MPLLEELTNLVAAAHTDITDYHVRQTLAKQSSAAPAALPASSALVATATSASTPGTAAATPDGSANEGTLAEAHTALVALTKTLLTLLIRFDEKREEWWASKEEARRKWAEEGAQEKLAGLQTINMKAKEMALDMRIKASIFCRYNLGVNPERVVNF